MATTKSLYPDNVQPIPIPIGFITKLIKNTSLYKNHF